jgi:hypothetical protein
MSGAVHHHGPVAQPTVTRGEDDRLVLDWPDTDPAEALVSRELFLELFDAYARVQRMPGPDELERLAERVERVAAPVQDHPVLADVAELLHRLAGR